MKFLKIFLLSIGLTLIFTGCTGMSIVSRERAIALATVECRKGHLVLRGEPSNANAAQMTLQEAEAPLTTAGQTTAYDIPMSSQVWLVKIYGTFEVIGGPPLPDKASATPIPPKAGICNVIIEANHERALGVYNTFQ